MLREFRSELEFLFGGMAQRWHRAQNFNKPRNMHEAFALCVILDSIPDPDSPTWEITARRLIGVALADQYRSWAICTVVEVKSYGSFLSAGVMNRLFRQAATRIKFDKRANSVGDSSRPSSYFSKQGKRGGGGSNSSSSSSSSSSNNSKSKNNYRNNNSKKSGTGPSAGADF